MRQFARQARLSYVLASFGAVLFLLVLAQRSWAQGSRALTEVQWSRRTLSTAAVLGAQFPTRIARTREGFVLFDHGARGLIAVSDAGAIRWRFGRLGSAPGEFRGASGLAVDGQDRIWVTDGALNRITIISADGRLIRAITPDAVIAGAIPAHDGFVASAIFAHPYILAFDSTGRTRRRVPIPPVLVGRNPVESQIALATGGDSELIAASKVTGWLFFTPLRSDSTLQVSGPSPVPFPIVEKFSIRAANGKSEDAWRPAKGTVYTTRSLHATETRLYVLTGTMASPAPRTIDVWDRTSRRYLHSLNLPTELQDFVPVGGNCIAGIVNEGEPRLERLCWTATKLPR